MIGLPRRAVIAATVAGAALGVVYSLSPMFAFFVHSVGVANVARFTDRISDQPKFVTQASSGAGFAELVAHLLR